MLSGKTGLGAQAGLYVMHLSVHGLVRAENPELGRDADTGGQVRYVIDLARALARHPGVRRVDVVTRRIVDPKVAPDYALEIEPIAPKATIRRLAFGPERYIRKELLWPHLQELVDRLLQFIRLQGEIPDIIHGHYADAGLVAVRVAKVLGIPVVFTGHSLGRYKKARLIANGASLERAEETFKFSHRIEAEEETLENAALVIASTSSEICEQYKAYDHYDRARMRILPPGCDVAWLTERPSPAAAATLRRELSRFLAEPDKPPLVILARPDRQKNIPAALHAFGRSTLRERANLVLFVGARDNLKTLEPPTRLIYVEMLRLIDLYDLYGHVAYPKTHTPEIVGAMFHRAARAGGLLLAPSRHENFGLTLVEAASVGLPVVSSGAGGMRDVLEACGHGVIADPDNAGETAAAADALLNDPERWRLLARRGKRAARRLYRWSAHVAGYVSALAEIRRRSRLAFPRTARPRRFVSARSVLVCDIDDTLTGERASIKAFNALIEARQDILFGVATGRSLEGAIETLRAWGIVEPNFFITAVGGAIHYDLGGLREDVHWRRHIQFQWKPEQARDLVATIPGLRPQEPEAQGPFKISFYCDAPRRTLEAEITQALRRNLVRARVIITRGHCVDVVPLRASKGHALRYLTWKWGFAADRVVAAGDAGNDIEMMRGATKAVVVANHSDELEDLRGEPDVFFSDRPSAAGVIDGLRHYEALAQTAAAVRMRRPKTRAASPEQPRARAVGVESLTAARAPAAPVRRSKPGRSAP